jgi:hypothetical protein
MAKTEVKQEKTETKTVVETPPNVTNGEATVNDHEKRIWLLEKKAGLR